MNRFKIMSLKLTYALHKNELVHVSQVVKGKACNCICPCCKATLIARKGNVKRHHFAHYNIEECKGAIESALHLLAKDIIEEEKRIVIPELKFYDANKADFILLTKSRMIAVDSVSLEVSYGNFQPDIVLSVGTKTIFVEIAVTHFVDDDKLDKLIDFGESTIEIDLSNIDPDFTKDSLKPLLIESVQEKRWLYSNQQELLKEKHYSNIKKQEEAINAKWEYDSAWYKYRIEKAKYYGYNRLESDFRGLIICQKQMKSSLVAINNHHSIFRKLKNNGVWNGELCETNEGANFVVIDNEVCYFSPSWNKKEKASKEQIKGYQRVWAILNDLSKQSRINPIDCKNCKHFDDYILEPHEVSCKFK